MVNKVRMSRQEAAESLRVSTKTIDRWVELGKLEADASLGRKRFVLVPEDVMPGYVEPVTEAATETGQVVSEKPQEAQQLGEDDTRKLTANKRRDANKAEIDAIKSDIELAEVKGLRETPEELRQREEAVFQSENKLADATEAVTEREKAVEGLADARTELQDILSKAIPAVQWLSLIHI